MITQSPGIDFIRAFAEYDKSDPQASTLALIFDLAEAWYLSDGEVLPGFRLSELLSVEGLDRESRKWFLYVAMQDELIMGDDVTYWLTVLNRLSNRIFIAGRSY
jgi:hypothetical protein